MYAWRARPLMIHGLCVGNSRERRRMKNQSHTWHFLSRESSESGVEALQRQLSVVLCHVSLAGSPVKNVTASPTKRPMNFLSSPTYGFERATKVREGHRVPLLSFEILSILWSIPTPSPTCSLQNVSHFNITVSSNKFYSLTKVCSITVLSTKKNLQHCSATCGRNQRGLFYISSIGGIFWTTSRASFAIHRVYACVLRMRKFGTMTQDE